MAAVGLIGIAITAITVAAMKEKIRTCFVMFIRTPSENYLRINLESLFDYLSREHENHCLVSPARCADHKLLTVTHFKIGLHLRVAELKGKAIELYFGDARRIGSDHNAINLIFVIRPFPPGV